MITISLIDDSPKWLFVAERRLNHISDVLVLSKFDSPMDFVTYCYQQNPLPDVVITDIDMPGINGVQLTDFLTDHFPTIKVFCMSSYMDVDLLADVIACGAYGLVSKEGNLADLPAAITAIHSGRVYSDAAFANYPLDRTSLMRTRRYLPETREKVRLSDHQHRFVSQKAF